MTRRPVRRGTLFVDRATALFPRGGSADGRPSFELFEAQIVSVCEARFSTGFDDLPAAVPWVPIRFVMTHALPFFPPLVVFGMLVMEGDQEIVELVDVITDDDYYDTVELDPDD